MDPVIIKVTSPNRMIAVKGVPVRTPCDIKVTNEQEKTFMITLLQSQGLLFEVKGIEKPKKKTTTVHKPAPAKKKTAKKKKVDTTTPAKPESTLEKMMDGNEDE